MRYGANSALRTAHEHVLKFSKETDPKEATALMATAKTQEVKRNITMLDPSGDPTRMDLQLIALQLIEVIEQQQARIERLERANG